MMHNMQKLSIFVHIPGPWCLELVVCIEFSTSYAAFGVRVDECLDIYFCVFHTSIPIYIVYVKGYP